jgi:hypothetical protein
MFKFLPQGFNVNAALVPPSVVLGICAQVLPIVEAVQTTSSCDDGVESRSCLTIYSTESEDASLCSELK